MKPHPFFRGRPVPPTVDPFSEPAYPREHSGTCLVIGTGPTMYDDLSRAYRLKRDHLWLFGIRRTALLVDCDAVFSLDRDSLHAIVAAHFLPGLAPEAHSTQPPAPRSRADYPRIDYWWRGVKGSVTSAWAAAKIALFMGFDEVILAGVPLEPGAYADGMDAPTFDNAKNLKAMRDAIRLDHWAHASVKALSGWPREFLGGPS